ncbi:MAG: hypothetical protein A3I07_04330 [Candidatus Doudnabacteria bacterium RIFCSPLOWO2_02_FULL_42_9]|uniref:Uncharacterized protein n=1 Tax=Candidatus Doudnabacteria bacterium RIFCSPHIGHO2_01_FULL_41_86 TaxID=1817821 RepID=A0A1F5N7Q6_9BACT|nr:MAG: hypothetical protein A2717_03775 [Candidatus Doudnabacteria bacterium RIFCSPHIGHO2_01_FULL_41_86]OGE74790.1 MAG: hypothetical protein A3K07_03370 [Candidatus Doudnabacteria bacterium RIFCSPHIGHO2_01_43_10]OGE85757.1 MAG: hypothetical protein A3E28_03105 [Candidatus Doudnabacteria bacterium RIFCSPHIGHO2_12_FULL_42_22]OGE87252.1 MAG: hypothetical protein A3C49_00730 [Candidatus Doudnabacteria bacterium RIFCSPHIGHO2_02_FULL_42_25]OGE92089.1 MAG: hypothetical protein A2895_00605 [Candidatus
MRKTIGWTLLGLAGVLLYFTGPSQSVSPLEAKLVPYVGDAGSILILGLVFLALLLGAIGCIVPYTKR